MTGQEQILALRRSGRSPRTVWVHDSLVNLRDGATVCLSPQDMPEQQDWRFLVGLNVLVYCEDESRMQRISAACAHFAKRVIAHLHGAEPVADCYGYTDYPLLKMTDSLGVLTWPE